MKEIWKEILGYENLYEVSNLGKVRNMRTGRILKPGPDKDGYLLICLYKNGRRTTNKLHRLVAQAFLPNSSKPQINHKDEDKTNNCVNNLEWCDAKYNANYGTRNKKVSERNGIPVLQFNMQGDLIKEFPSLHSAALSLGISKQAIWSSCNNINKTCCGFIWKYKN